MAICVEYGISHSHFSGGKNRWTGVDRAYAVAYQRWLNERHSACGTKHDDWFDDDGRPLEEPMWVATIEECQGCREIARAQQAIEEGSTGLYVTMKPFATSVLASDDEQIEGYP